MRVRYEATAAMVAIAVLSTPSARADSHLPESPVGFVAPFSDRFGARAAMRPAVSTSDRSAACDAAVIELDGDEEYENAIGWQFEGVAAPDLGAMAQIYAGRRVLCSIVLDLAQSGGQPSLGMDLYVWDNVDGAPGAVRAMVTGTNPGAVSTWPEVGRHVLPLSEPSCADVDSVWVGYWPSWVGERAGWFVGADLDGPPGRSLTKIAPGLGFPTGWQNVTTAWGPLSALGIGASFETCVPEPVVSSSWGELKSLFR